MTTKLASLTELWQEFDLPGTQVSTQHTAHLTLQTAQQKSDELARV